MEEFVVFLSSTSPRTDTPTAKRVLLYIEGDLCGVPPDKYGYTYLRENKRAGQRDNGRDEVRYRYGTAYVVKKIFTFKSCICKHTLLTA